MKFLIMKNNKFIKILNKKTKMYVKRLKKNKPLFLISIVFFKILSN